MGINNKKLLELSEEMYNEQSNAFKDGLSFDDEFSIDNDMEDILDFLSSEDPQYITYSHN